MSGTGVEKLQTILMAQVSTIDQPDQISIDYTKRFIFANYLSFNTSFGWIPPPPFILVNLSIVLNSFYFFLYHVIFGWMIWSLIITLDTLSIWLFALPVGCSQKPYHCIHSSTWRLLKNHQSCKSEGSRNREKVFVQRLSQLNCKMKNDIEVLFLTMQTPREIHPRNYWGSRIETLEERFEDLHAQFRENKFFFFIARKTIAKGKVRAKYLKHLNYSFILIIGFFKRTLILM